jgi:hypothetical protein
LRKVLCMVVCLCVGQAKGLPLSFLCILFVIAATTPVSLHKTRGRRHSFTASHNIALW